MKEETNKISVIAKLLGLSMWMFLFTWEGSFSIQSIIPFIFVAIVYVIFLKKTVKFKMDKCQKKLLYIVLLIMISTVINSIIHVDVVTIYNLIGIIYFMLIFIWFYICTNEKYNIKEINFIIINYILVSTILSILTIRLSLLGTSGKIAITNFVGTLTDENWTSAIISLAPIYILMLLLHKKNKATYKIVLIILFIINILGICLTGSRAALIGCLLGIFCVFINYFCNNFNAKKMLITILLIVGCIIIAIIAKNIMPEWIFNRYFNSNYMDNSNSTRLLIWKNAIEGISDQPLLGFGMGTFSFLEEYEYTAGVSVPGHNTYLDMALYSGIIGLILYLSFLWDVIKDIIIKKGRRKFIGVLVTLLFISCIVGADKTVFLWNTLILIRIVNKYMNDKEYIEKQQEERK